MPISRLPQPVRKTVPTTSPTPFPQAHPRRSFLSPKALWSPTSPITPKPVTKYQLQDPGAVPSTATATARQRQPANRQAAVPSGLPLPRARPHHPPGLRDQVLDSPVSTAATVAPASPAPRVRAVPTPVVKKTPAPSVLTQRHVSHRSSSSSLDSQAQNAPSASMSPASSTASADMTLIWQPDPESSGRSVSDPAENLWKEIELRMGGRQRSDIGKEGRKDERGQWVLAQRQRAERSAARVERDAPAPTMEKAESEFTVSAYFHPDFDRDGDGDEQTPQPQAHPGTGAGAANLSDTALFDMSAPLVHSRSSHAATPANTPCLRAETLRRAPRVAKKGSSSGRSSGSERSNSSDSLSSQTSGSTDPHPRPMYKLDSHVVAALEALSHSYEGDDGEWNSDKLDLALSLSGSPSASSGYGYQEPIAGEGGLGLGLHIRHDSVYSLQTTSPTPRPTRGATRRGRSVQVTDLDTGLVSLHRLDQLNRTRLG